MVLIIWLDRSQPFSYKVSALRVGKCSSRIDFVQMVPLSIDPLTKFAHAEAVGCLSNHARLSEQSRICTVEMWAQRLRNIS